MLGRIAPDGEELRMTADGGHWMMAWHPPGGPPPQPPPGQPHGANALCLTSDGAVVLISPDGERWGWPGRRPELGESWDQILRREIAEEACATVTAARLLALIDQREEAQHAGLDLRDSYYSPDELAARHHLGPELAANLAGVNALTDALVAP